MTKDQFMLVLRFYRHALSSQDDLGAVAVPQMADLNAFATTEGQFGHLLAMLDRMEDMYNQDSEKAMRWLGFMQGVLWSLEIYTIDELRIHNTSPDL